MIGRKGNSFISCGNISLAGIRNGAGRDVFIVKVCRASLCGGRIAKNLIGAKFIPEPGSPRATAGGLRGPLSLRK